MFPEKAAAIKRFEYLLLGKKLKEKTDIAKKQYKKLDDTFVFYQIINKRKPILVNYKSNLIVTVSIVFTNIVVTVKNLIAFL